MINLTITAVVVLTTFSFKPVEKVKREIKVASSKIL